MSHLGAGQNRKRIETEKETEQKPEERNPKPTETAEELSESKDEQERKNEIKETHILEESMREEEDRMLMNTLDRVMRMETVRQKTVEWNKRNEESKEKGEIEKRNRLKQCRRS